MNIEELNQKLITLKASEERYRAGEVFEWSRVGHEFVVLEDDIKHGESKAREMAASVAGPGLAITRNSRFNAVPTHTHNHIEISYVYLGKCPQTVDGKRVLLRENQVLLLDTNCPHSIDALGEGDVMLSMVLSKEYLQARTGAVLEYGGPLVHFLMDAFNDQADHNRYVRFHAQNNRRVRRYMQELLCEYYDPSPSAQMIVAHLFELLLAELINVYEHDLERRETDAPGERTSVVPIIRYIEQSYRSCTLKSVAEHFYLSPNYVSALLKRHTGMTFVQVVQVQKLARAAALLRGGSCTVERAAHEVGYNNMSFFYRKFRERYGTSPAEYAIRA